jgi:DNA replication protein DnaC
MKISELDIYKSLKEGKSVLLVGPTGVGKTWFVKNKLIALIESKGETVQYIDGHIEKQKIIQSEYLIVDEFETFLDSEFLQKIYPKEKLYYESEYIKNILKWHEFLKKDQRPTLFILTRNGDEEINNIIQNVNKTDWGKEVTVVGCKKS